MSSGNFKRRVTIATGQHRQDVGRQLKRLQRSSSLVSRPPPNSPKQSPALECLNEDEYPEGMQIPEFKQKENAEIPTRIKELLVGKPERVSVTPVEDPIEQEVESIETADESDDDQENVNIFDSKWSWKDTTKSRSRCE